MAETSVGGVSWYVDADTKPAVDSIKQVATATDKAEKELKGLDAATKKTSKSMKDMSASTKATASNVVKLDAQAAKLKKSAAGVDKALGGVSRRAGMAGIQIQQFVGQVQGGQSPMVALSQQSADLGFVLGMPLLGAIAGITASIAGPMVSALMGGKNGIELMEEATERLKATLTLSAEGVVDYTDSMKQLARVSTTLAQTKLELALSDQLVIIKESAKQATDEINDLQSSAASLFGTPGDDFKDFAKSLTGISDVTPELKESILTIRQSLSSLSRATEDTDIEGHILDLSYALEQLTVRGNQATPAAKTLARSVLDASKAFLEGQLTLEGLQKTIKEGEKLDLDIDTSSIDAVSSMVAALKEQAKALHETNRQTAIRVATEKGATAAQLAAINAAFGIIEAQEQRIETEKRLDKQMKASFANEQKIESKRVAAKEKARREEERDREAAAREQQTKVTNAVTTTESVITRGRSPDERRAAEREKIQAFRDENLISAKQYQEAMTQIEKDGARGREQISAMAMGSFSNSFGQLATVIKDSGHEQSNAYKAMFALAKGFAVAQAGLNFALAVSNASAVTPWYASLAAVSSVVASGGAVIGAVANATYSGRENGGPVLGGQTYEVGEKNKPELLMIPGNNGKVLSNQEMKGLAGGKSNGATQPIINNYAAADGYTVSHRRDELTRRDVFDIVRAEFGDSNSVGRRSMGGNSNLTGVLNSQRRS